MGRLGRGLFGFFGGLLVGAATVAVVGFVAGYLFDISQAEGAYAMGVVFFWVPLGGIVGGIIGAVWASARRPT
jgi:hypothetical protein